MEKYLSRRNVLLFLFVYPLIFGGAFILFIFLGENLFNFSEILIGGFLVLFGIIDLIWIVGVIFLFVYSIIYIASRVINKSKNSFT